MDGGRGQGREEGRERREEVVGKKGAPGVMLGPGQAAYRLGTD